MRKKQVQDDCSDDDNIPKGDPLESLKNPTDDEHEARGRSFAKRPNSIAGRLRSRSRHRSLSVSRHKRAPSNPNPNPQCESFTAPGGMSSLSSSSKEKQDVAATAPLPGEPMSGISRATAILNRHERALKTELLQLIEYQEKEIQHWKKRALEKDVRDMISEPEAWEEPKPLNSSLQNLTGDTNSQVAALAGELKMRDDEVTNLRKILETQEKANEDRVRMLESQLEKLIEAQAERVALMKSSKKNKSSFQDGGPSSTNLRQSASSFVSEGTDVTNTDEEKDPGNEVAVL